MYAIYCIYKPKHTVSIPLRCTYRCGQLQLDKSHPPPQLPSNFCCSRPTEAVENCSSMRPTTNPPTHTPPPLAADPPEAVENCSLMKCKGRSRCEHTASRNPLTLCQPLNRPCWACCHQPCKPRNDQVIHQYMVHLLTHAVLHFLSVFAEIAQVTSTVR